VIFAFSPPIAGCASLSLPAGTQPPGVPQVMTNPARQERSGCFFGAPLVRLAV
jgi:hypothetical protein